MKVVVQRVRRAKVSVDNQSIGAIKKGLLLLVGIGKDDENKTVEKMAKKIVMLRIFSDKHQKMNLSVLDTRGEVLAIPQFTLFAETKGQNRPFFGEAAKEESAKQLFDYFIAQLKLLGAQKVSAGEFGAYMQVESVNDGPVTIILDSNKI